MTVTLVWTKHYCCLLWAVHTCFIYLQSSKECGVWLQALWAASWLALLFLIKGVPYQQCSFPSACCFADLLSEGHDTSEKNRVLAQPVGLVLLHTKVWAAALHMGPAEKGAELVMSETSWAMLNLPPAAFSHTASYSCNSSSAFELKILACSSYNWTVFVAFKSILESSGIHILPPVWNFL